MKRRLGQNSHFSVDAILFYRCVLYQSIDNRIKGLETVYKFM